MENAIHILDKKERLFYFIVIILITMIGAPITSGIIMQKLGGYESKKNNFSSPFLLYFFFNIFKFIIHIF